MSDIKVSISCITYNQRDYISDALDSFLMQKTNFKYEILVHDDASTDGTADILREYEKKYPDIIKVIYQTENQYSKGIKITLEYLLPLYKGKYIAYCEGDDYWTDPYKLQKQFDYMENNEECSLCMHSSVEVKADNKSILSRRILSKEIKEYDIIDAVKGLGRKTATNSFFLKREVALQKPEFRIIAPCGDYILPILAALYGKIIYLPDVMSAHRANANGSLTQMWKKNTNTKKLYYEKFDKMIESLNKYTDYKYSEHLKEESVRNWSLYYIMTRDKNKTKIEPYKSYIESLPFKVRLRFFVEINMPGLIIVARKIKHTLIDMKYRIKERI